MKQLSALAMITLVVSLVLSSCAPAPRQMTAEAKVPAQEITSPTVSQPSSTPTTSASQVTSLSPKEPVLSSQLTCNCPSGPTTNRGFEKVGLNIGAKAIDFIIKDINGKEYRLSRLLAEKPVMLVFGSFT